MTGRDKRSAEREVSPPGGATPAANPVPVLRERAEAEAVLREKAAQSPDNLDALSPEAIGRMIHELRVHQIELEMQNEELRRAQVELDAARSRYFDLYDLAPAGYVTLSENGLILEANLAVATLFGVARGALVKQPITRFILKEDQDAYYLQRKHLMETGELQVCELRMVKGGGTPFWAHLASTFAQDEGGARVLRVLLSDITERKQAEAVRASLEAQLRESQKMEAIGTLAGGIARDFNNALATILGNVELARQDVSANPFALESLEEIRKAGVRVRDLVQQILFFSRRQPTEHKLTALAPVVEESVRLLRATLPARLTLQVHCDADVPPVLADATQVEQVLINLVTNAMQAMRGSPGRIGIRLDTVMFDAALADAHLALREMHAKRPGRTVRLAVSDDGPGMDAATLERVFEPFFTTKPVDEGTGLGLAVVHGIVQAHEGAIVVNSQPGKGTSFTLYLPAAQAQAGAPEPDESAAAATATLDMGGGRHILYLDDDDSLVFLVERLLERRGYRVSGYIDQREALAALRADPAGFDLVVTDYNMPGMSGLDVAREARTIRADLPVAVASGFIDEALRARAGAAGVRELIFKANTVEDLCEAFARLAQAVAETPKAS